MRQFKVDEVVRKVLVEEVQEEIKEEDDDSHGVVTTPSLIQKQMR